MSSLKETLQHDLHTAMKAHDKVTAATLRMVLTAITTAEVAGESAHELSEAETLKVVAKEGKKRSDAAAEYRKANRPELAEAEEAELAVLEGYLPAQLSDAEVEAIVDRVVTESGATGMAQMGQIMKAVQAEVAGRADGGRIAPLVKARLAG